MSDFRALCAHLGKCTVCGETATDTHINQAHAAPVIARAMRDYRDGLKRGEEDTEGWDGRRPLTDQVLANIAKTSTAFVLAYRKAMAEVRLRDEADQYEDEGFDSAFSDW